MGQGERGEEREEGQRGVPSISPTFSYKALIVATTPGLYLYSSPSPSKTAKVYKKILKKGLEGERVRRARRGKREGVRHRKGERGNRKKGGKINVEGERGKGRQGKSELAREIEEYLSKSVFIKVNLCKTEGYGKTMWVLL